MDCLVVIELSKYCIHFGIVCVLEMQMIRRQKCPFPAIRLEQNNNKAVKNKLKYNENNDNKNILQ